MVYSSQRSWPCPVFSDVRHKLTCPHLVSCTISKVHGGRHIRRATLLDGHVLACGFIRITQENENLHYIWSVFAWFDLMFHKLKSSPPRCDASCPRLPTDRRRVEGLKGTCDSDSCVVIKHSWVEKGAPASTGRQVDRAHASDGRQPLFVTVYKWWVTPCLAAAPRGWLNIPCYPSGRAAGRGGRDTADEPLRCRSAERLKVFES